MVDQLRDRVVVADDDAIEAHLAAKPVAQQGDVRRHRHAVEIGEGRHQRRDAGADRRCEARQMHFAQGALGDVHGSVLPPRGDRAVRDEMLRTGGQRFGRRQIGPLETAHLGLRDARVEPGVFAWALRSAAPAGIARHVEHRRESHRQTFGRAFARGLARRALPEGFVEDARLRERDRKERAMAVDDVQADQQRNAKPRILDGQSLHLVRGPGTDHVQQIADRAVDD